MELGDIITYAMRKRMEQDTSDCWYAREVISAHQDEASRADANARRLRALWTERSAESLRLLRPIR